MLFRIVVASQLEADHALCRRSAVVSGDCCARPTVTGVGRRYGAVVTAYCRTLRGSVSQEGVNRVEYSEYSSGQLRPPVHLSDAERASESGGG
jgi:hypothetical protein